MYGARGLNILFGCQCAYVMPARACSGIAMFPGSRTDLPWLETR